MLHGIHSRDRSSGGDYDDLLRQSPSTDDSAQSQTTPHQSAMFPLSDKHKYGRAPHTDTICYATGWTDRDAEGEYIASAPTFDENRPACIVDGARRCGYNVVYAHNIQKTDNPKSGDYVDEYGGYPVESVPVAAERVGATDAIQHHCAKFSDDFRVACANCRLCTRPTVAQNKDTRTVGKKLKSPASLQVDVASFG